MTHTCQLTFLIFDCERMSENYLVYDSSQFFQIAKTFLVLTRLAYTQLDNVFIMRLCRAVSDF